MLTSALYDPKAFELVSKEELRDAMSSGQVMSKQWLLDNLHHITDRSSDQVNGTVVGGWLGVLASAMNFHDPRLVIDSHDIDPRLQDIADLTLHLNRGRAYTADMHQMYYGVYELVVNTSLEHIRDVGEWVSLLTPDTFVIAQSNNARFIVDHINCVDSAKELEAQLGLKEVYFSDELVFPMYTRYMVIGKT
jgi:hypothetical protein